MDIKDEMLKALALRKGDVFGFGCDLVVDGVDLGKMRSMIGYKGIDLAPKITVKEEYINGVRIFVYNEDKADTSHILFFTHGGGFYGGGAKLSEDCCKYLAKKGDMMVVNIDYTLAPESKFPDTGKEVYEIVKYVSSRYPFSKFGIVGDSAGGHLAINVAQLDAKEDKILSFVFAYYPVISLEAINPWNINMYNLNEPCERGKWTIQFLRSIMKYIDMFYVKKGQDKSDSMFNLNKMSMEEFKSLPKMIIAEVEFDYFNLEIDEFCNKYGVRKVFYPRLAHGFIELMGYVKEVEELMDLTVKEFKG